MSTAAARARPGAAARQRTDCTDRPLDGRLVAALRVALVCGETCFDGTLAGDAAVRGRLPARRQVPRQDGGSYDSDAR